MTTILARRRLIAIILLCFAVVGALMRQFAAPASTMRDVGTLLMLLWLPIIGSVVGWLFVKLRRPATSEPSTTFEAGSAFVPHALVELTVRPSQLPSEDTLIAEGEHRCALVVDNQGFSARLLVPPGQAFRRGEVQTLQIEFLKPAAALPRFPPDAAFRMLVGESFVGDGHVLQVLGRA